MTSFDLETSREGAQARLTLFGELDIAAAPRLDAELTELEPEGPDRIVLDLRGLTFLDSTGLRSLLGADARAREAGRSLTLIQGPDVVQRVFSITGLDGRLDIVEDEAALLASGPS
ncbi:MAG: STAS domain-containing protein [Thermoleophilaceae bacterium]|jgi:anti-anti-sigma factor|nr:STAS domain-containing protein [Thermoleophilaceae bacterium]MBA3840812.1 STAS domain-containing protein [Thermoleophilaceae bacterium]